MSRWDAETICVHSDTPNAIEILTSLREAMSKSSIKQDSQSTHKDKMPYIVD